MSSVAARLHRARSSVRVRVTLLAAGAFAVAFFVAAAVLLRGLETRLVDDVRSEGEAALLHQVALVDAQGLPPNVAFIGGVTFGQFVQDGRMFSIALPEGMTPEEYRLAVASGDVESWMATASQQEAAIGGALSGVGTTADVITAAVPIDGAVLATASPLDEVRDTIDATTRLLWLVGPALVALVAGLAWMLASRALRPVRLLTSRVSEIESHSLHERVPEPPSSDEIAVLARTMNEMLGRLDAANESSRRLVSDASHELRTPIAVMRTELEVAGRDPDADWSATSGVLREEVDRLERLVDDLLLLARNEERPTRIDRAGWVDCVDCVDCVELGDLAHDVTARRRRPDVDVSVDTTSLPTGVTLCGDRVALQRALDHVVSNAARSATARVEVSIGATPGDLDDGLAMHVDDDGPGIPVDQRHQVVRRFVRLDEGRSRDAGGAGLGLAVASEVAAAHGGRLEITDSPLGGARVSILLPAGTVRRASIAADE